MQQEKLDKGSYEVRKRGWKFLSLLRVVREEDGKEVREYGVRLWNFILLFEVPELFAAAVEKQLAADDAEEAKEDQKEEKEEAKEEAAEEE